MSRNPYISWQQPVALPAELAEEYEARAVCYEATGGHEGGPYLEIARQRRPEDMQVSKKLVLCYAQTGHLDDPGPEC